MSALAAAQPRSDVASHEAYAERLYERHQRAIFGFCLKQLRRREDADDAVQTTFIYALLSLRRGIVPQMELPWLLTIARNVCSTRRRTGMRRSAHETPHDFDLIQDKLAMPERSDAATTEDFTAALRAIPETQRKALLLREWKGLSYEEIGTELGLSQGATEALLFRARQNVAQRLGERTGLKSLRGLPYLSFLRDLFQTAGAKLVAVGVGGALAVVAVPAAQTQAPAPAPALHEAAVVQRTHATARTAPAAATRAPGARVPARNDVGARATGSGGGSRTPLRPPSTSSPAAGTTSAPTPPAQAAARASAPPAAAAQPPVVPPTTTTSVTATATGAVNDLLGTVSDVTGSVPQLTVTVPVTLPPLPVQTPPVPTIKLP